MPRKRAGTKKSLQWSIHSSKMRLTLSKKILFGCLVLLASLSVYGARIKDLTDVVNVGDTFKVKLIEIDKMNRMNLSKKQAEANEVRTP